MNRNVLFALVCSVLLVSAAYLAGFGTVATFTDSANADGNVSSAAEFADDVTVVDAAGNAQPSSGGNGTGQQCGSGHGAAGNTAGNAPSGGAGNASPGDGLAGCGGTGGNDGTDGGRYVAPAARPLTVGGRR